MYGRRLKFRHGIHIEKEKKWECAAALDARPDRGTHQPHQQEADKRHLAHDGGAVDVAKAHRAHGHHQEVHTVPVADAVGLGEVRRVASVL